jgi:hypothetical protein
MADATGGIGPPPPVPFVNTETGDLTVAGRGYLTAVSNSGGDLSSLTGTVATQGTDITGLNGDVGTINGNVGTLQSQVTALEAAVTTLNGDIGTLNGEVTTLQAQVAGLQADVLTLQGQVATLIAQLAAGTTGTIHLAKLTVGGTNGSITVTSGGIAHAFVDPT